MWRSLPAANNLINQKEVAPSLPVGCQHWYCILGVFWRHGHSSWDFGRARKHTACDIHARGNVRGSIEVWLQFYQYDWPDENWPGIRTARLRNQPPIHRGTAARGLEQPYPVIS